MKIVVLGAGISGHTAAAFLKKKLGKKHDVIVISPKPVLSMDSIQYLDRCWSNECRSGAL